ncbi:hypothetical protein J3R30DRAFT_736421 [Lentinula aciculospora]|uniref:Uncharacterized protein n=1 Tax=Lentinula aciculospora TaxID=153920 RepID=A0A9W9DJT8_9AGAR|nr:hypothetical protein J3R30DRAFT_736421 [Lentinula aciculospora]
MWVPFFLCLFLEQAKPKFAKIWGPAALSGAEFHLTWNIQDICLWQLTSSSHQSQRTLKLRLGWSSTRKSVREDSETPTGMVFHKEICQRLAGGTIEDRQCRLSKRLKFRNTTNSDNCCWGCISMRRI